jgi:hypothetical protein
VSLAEDLDRVVGVILVDCYGEDEEYTAFLTVLEEELGLPTAASLLGAPVTVTALDYQDPREGWSPAATARTAPARSAWPTWPFLPTRLLPGCTPPTATFSVSSRSRRPRDPTGPGPTDADARAAARPWCGCWPRDAPVVSTGSHFRTHQHRVPAGATCCHSLPLGPNAIITFDLHEWLFLLVTGPGKLAQSFPYHGCALPTELGGVKCVSPGSEPVCEPPAVSFSGLFSGPSAARRTPVARYQATVTRGMVHGLDCGCPTCPWVRRGAIKLSMVSTLVVCALSSVGLMSATGGAAAPGRAT